MVTNGCFDLLHAGHAAMLHQAKSLGQWLVVGLNDDASIAQLKGAGRPFNSQADRAYVLASLAAVDLVVIFSGTTAVDVIRLAYADLWVKGGDYTLASLNPAEVQAARERGTSIHILPRIAGQSSTVLAERIKAGSAARVSALD